MIKDIALVLFTAVLSSSVTWLVFTGGSGESVAMVAAKESREITQGAPSSYLAVEAEECAEEEESLKGDAEEPGTVKLLVEGSQGVEDKNASDYTHTEMKEHLNESLHSNFSNYISSAETASPDTLAAQIETRFFEEEWDQQWAGEKEDAIHHLFQENSDLQNMVAMDINCRSKNCQIVVSAENIEQSASLSDFVLPAIMSSDLGMRNQSVSYFLDPSSANVVFYLSEDQHAGLLR